MVIVKHSQKLLQGINYILLNLAFKLIILLFPVNICSNTLSRGIWVYIIAVAKTHTLLLHLAFTEQGSFYIQFAFLI